MRNQIGWEPTSRDFRVASARIRCLNPILELQKTGFPVELFDAARRDRYGAVVISKRYDASMLAEAERLKKEGVRVLFDLCDNRFYSPRQAPEREEEIGRLLRMMDLADELVASTEPLAEIMKAKRASAKPVTVIGDAVETLIVGTALAVLTRWFNEWRCGRLNRRLGPHTPLVWFGHHGSDYADGGMSDLLRIRDTLERAHARHPLSLTVISNNAAKFRRLVRGWAFPTHYLAWHPATFFPALRAHAVAVIPIERTDFTRCKTSNRPATALAAGVAVVADSIPSYEPLRFATALDDWDAGLERYLASPEERRKDAEAGRSFVMREYGIGRIAGQWKALFERVLRT